jgi:Uma2 family endonuclease
MSANGGGAVAHFTLAQYELMIKAGVFEPREQNHVEFIRGEIREMNTGTSTIAHLTLAQYELMIKAGVFEPREQNRVEFIKGEIREMSPIGSLHEAVLDRLNEWSFASLPKGKAWVRIQSSIVLPGLASAPQPDLVWVKRRDYSEGHPTAADVLLLVEVAESSLPYDTGEKAEMYAAAGIADCWVVNLNQHSIEVRRNPVAGRYSSLQTFSGNDEIHPLALPEAALKAGTLWEPLPKA